MTNKGIGMTSSISRGDTQCLLIGLLVGYLSLIFCLGLRPLVLFSGALISGFTLVIWYRPFKPQTTHASTATQNLLQKDFFLSRLQVLTAIIPKPSLDLWQSTQQQAIKIQEIAAYLSQQEPTFIPDLLETLHTVLALIEQMGQAVQATHQIQTPRYQALAEQKLQSSLKHLQHTHDQLQALHDQSILASLGESSETLVPAISNRLQILISENTSGILVE